MRRHHRAQFSLARMGRAIPSLLVTFALIVVWGAVLVRSMGSLDRFETTAGKPSNPPPRWPQQSCINHSTSRPTLVMLAHPHCPCTRASIGELAVLMRYCVDRLDGYVLFFRPEGAPEGWEQTDLWDSASAIPGIRAVSDVGGQEARRFGAATSGAVVLYDGHGQLLFSGGITGSRGMSGENDGRQSIVDLVSGKSSHLSSTPVFGCQILDSPNQAACCKQRSKERACKP